VFGALSKPKNSVKHSADDCILSLSVGTDFFNSLFFTSSACAEARPLRSRCTSARSAMFVCVCVYLSPRRFIKPRKISLTLFDVPRAGGLAAHAPLAAAQRKSFAARLCLSLSHDKVNLRQSNIPRWRILHRT
jgi:hypothetical protein